MSEKAWVPLCERGRLSMIRIFAITLGQLTAMLIWIPCGVLLNPMLQKLEVSNAITTVLYLIGPISGVTLGPFLGVISDNSTFKLGRRRPFLFIGEVVAFAGMMFLSFADQMSNIKSVQIFCLFIGQILAMYGANFVFGPSRALVTDVVPQGQQVLASNICMVQQGLAGILSNTFGAVKLADKFSGLSLGYEQFVLIVTSVIGLIALAISCIVSPEEPLKEKRAVENPFVSMWRVIKLYDLNMWMLGLAYLFFASGVNQVATWFATFMAKIVYEGNPNLPSNPTADDQSKYDAYNDGVAFAQELSVYQTIFQIILGFTSHLISGRIGLAWTWALSMGLGVISCILMNINVGRSNRYFYIVPLFFYGVVMMTGYAVPLAVVSLYLDPEQMGGAQGIMNMFNNAGQFLVMFVLQLGFGSLADKYWSQGKKGFHYGNIIGLGSIFLFFATICGFFAISRAVKKSLPRLNEDVKPPKVSDEAMSSSV